MPRQRSNDTPDDYSYGLNDRDDGGQVKDLWKMSAREAVGLLKRGKVSPLELIDVAQKRIEATNPKLNAFVTLCYDRAREPREGDHTTVVR